MVSLFYFIAPGETTVAVNARPPSLRGQLGCRVHQLLANGGTDDDLLIVFSDDQATMGF